MLLFLNILTECSVKLLCNSSQESVEESLPELISRVVDESKIIAGDCFNYIESAIDFFQARRTSNEIDKDQ